MKKRNLKPIIISALMAVSFGATTVGTSFALFTDRADTSITVTAGIVEVESEIELVSYFSTVEGDEADVKVDLTNKTSHINPLTGSKFTLDPESKTVAIDKMLPGDTLVVKITNKNKSNVITKTRLATTHSTMANKEDLFPALSMNIAAVDGNNQAIAQPTKWRQTPAAGNLTEGDTISVATVRISFDEINEGILAREDGENNEFQDAACLINFALEAVQGNAKINPIDEINAYMLQNAMTGNHNATMHDAMEDVAALEYTAEVLAGYVYSIDDEQFVAENSVAAGKEYKYFKIYESMPTTQSFSIYAMGANWANTTINPLTVGFDAGVTTTASLKYAREDLANPHDVVIRTNGGNLTVDAPHDSVHHYGDAASVTILSVAGNSYHENGAVSFVEIAGGHFVFEEEAAVKAMHFDATGDTFKNADNLTISLDISKIETTALPEFSRDAVTIAENGTYVAEVKSDESEYIWLFGNGVKEQMVVADTGEEIAENGQLKEGIEKGAEDGSVAEQIANPALRNDEGKLVDEEGELVTPENAVVKDAETKWEVKTKAVGFDGGSGTQADPYLIKAYEGLVNVDIYKAIEGNLYFKMIADIDIKAHDSASWCHSTLYQDATNYHIDMNDHTITIGDKYLFGYASKLEMYNGNFVFDSNGSKASVIGYACEQGAIDFAVNFHDLVISGKSSTNGSTHYGPLVAYAYLINSGSSTFVANNVINNMTIESSNSDGYVGGLFGYVQGTNVSASITNCTFNGAISGAHVSAFINNCSAPKAGVVSTNNTLNGSLLGSIDARAFGCNGNVTGGTATLNELQASVAMGENAAMSVVTASTTLLSFNGAEAVLTREENVDYYIVAVSFNVDLADHSKGGFPRFISKRIEQFDSETLSTGIFKYAIVQESEDKSEGKEVVTRNNDTVIWIENGAYHIYEPDFVVSNNRATVYAYGYKDGNIVTYQRVGYTY